MGDTWRNNSMMIYVEKAIYESVDNEIVQPPLTLNPGSTTDHKSVYH